ncbi:autotransporter-associated beta strand repeat-containing protein, partial [bacterium]|nr:autotransporter-associated beta strand repeat-containing protein [bacterium]
MKDQKKSTLKYILASAVAVSSLGTLASAHSVSAPQINDYSSKKLQSTFEQTPFLVKAKTLAKGTRVVLAKKKSTPTGAAATVTEDDITTTKSGDNARTNQTSGTLTADKTKYENITASSGWFFGSEIDGGAIHSEVNTAITNSIFSNNKVEGERGIFSGNHYGFGGALYLKGNGITGTINNVIFTSNSAIGGGGGALYLAGGSNSNAMHVNITNATFDDNSSTKLSSSEGHGGAIYSTGYTSLTITDTDFTSNSAEGNGGAIYNNANNAMSIVASGSDVNFANNSASDNGGAIYNASGKTINFSTSNDKSVNFLTSSGSASNDIYNAGTININGDVKVETSISGNGTLNLNSGLLYVKQLSQGTLRLNGGTLSFQESDAETQDLATSYSSNSVSNLSGSGDLKIDVNMANAASDTLSVGSAASGTTLNLTSVNVGADYTGSSDSLVDYISYVTGGGVANITFTINGSADGELVTQSSTGTSYTFTLGSDGKLTVGDIHVTDEGLKEFIRGTLSTNTNNFSFTDNLQLEYEEAVGTTNNSVYNTLNMEMNGYNLTGENLDGITIADGYTLNVNGQAGSPSVISNFANAFVNDGVLNLKNITFSGNTTAIDNSNELNLSGVNQFNSSVTGNSGVTNITAGSTTLGSGYSLTQNELNISEGAAYTNSGTTTAVLNNEGSLVNNNIFNANSGSSNSGGISGEGTLNIDGTFNNNADLAQGTLHFGNGASFVVGNNAGVTLANTTNDANGGLFDSANNNIDSFNLGNVTLNSTLDVNLDITSTQIDSFTVADGSTGTISVTLSDVNAPVLDTIYQVVYGDNNNIVLSLASDVEDKTKDGFVSGVDDIGTVYNWSDNVGAYNQEITDTYHFEVYNSNSLTYVLDESLRQYGDKTYTGLYDVLQKLNQSEASEREFNATSANETYVVKDQDTVTGETISGLGTTSRGKLTINGVAEGDVRSTIDGNGKTLFELTLEKDGDTNTQVEINNVKITNAAKVATVSADNELALNNVEISGNTAGITNNGSLILSGSNVIANAIDGNAGSTQITGGTTTLSADMTQNTLEVADGAALVNSANINASVTNSGNITNTGAITTAGGSNSGTISGGRVNVSGEYTNSGNINTTLVNTGAIANTDGTISSTNGSSSGSINGGRLNISGSFNNTGVLSNAIINITDSSQLNYTANSGNSTFNNRMIGTESSEFNKFGSAELQMNGDQSGFVGTVNINEGTLAYSESSDNRFFNSSAVINVDNSSDANATLKYTSMSGKTLASGTLPEINLKDGATFDYTAGTGETNINSGFYNSVSGNNKLIFNGGNSDKIILNSDFNSNDTATFKDANLAFGSGLNTISGSLILDNTSLNVLDSSIVDYTINGLSSLNNSKVNVDISLGASLAGDRFIVENGSGVLNISQFRIIDDNGLFTSHDNSKIVQIIKNGSGSSLSLSASGAAIDGAWSTNVYEYAISSAKTDTDNDSMKFTGINISDANSLKKMNNYDNSTEENIRGFSVVNDSSTYHIGEDLGKTEHGTFVVNGTSKTDSIISGIRALGDWTSTGERGSMFELTESEKTTDFYLNNVTVQDAQVSSRGGSVLYAASDKADITISDVIIQNNTSSGQGGAFDIESAHSISISNSEFKGNSSDGLGGAIYSAVDLLISNTDFADNTAQEVSNDIYLASGADLSYTTGAQGNTISGGILSENSQSVFTKLGNAALNVSGSNSGFKGSVYIEEGDLNFVAKSADDSLFDTSDSSLNIANGAKLNIDDRGLVNLAASNINGKGTIDKNGAGTLNITGDNDNFTGTLNIKSGEVSYKEQGENASFFGAEAINMSSDTVLSVETTSENSIRGGNISSVGSGTVFNKLGSGSFDLIGTNNIGSVNVEQGTLNVASNADGTRTYNAGATSISQGAFLNYTADRNSVLTNLSGEGNLSKFGNSKLELSDYTFSGLAQVKEGILDVTSSNDNASDLDFDVEVYGDSEFDYTAGANSALSLNNNGKFAFDSNSSGAKGVFNNAKISLGEIANAANNTIVINNSSEISLTASNYSGSYEFNNSVLDIMDSDVSASLSDALRTYTFNNLTVNNSALTLDVSLGNNEGSDVLYILDGSGNFNLTKLAITEDNGIFDNDEKTKVFQVINNANGSVGILVSSGNPKLADWSTTIYEYEINAVKSDEANDYYDSIEFKGIRIASPDTLRTMNHEHNNSRGFSVVGSNIYHIARDLDETLSGDFVVIGNGKDSSIISGNRVSYTKNDDGTITVSSPIEGEYGSFFELTQNNTNLTVQDLTIQEAKRQNQAIKDGSVLYLNNGNSSALLNNIVFKDSSAQNGGAIANINSDSLTISGSDFTGNSAGVDGGVIYNASTGLSLTNSTADGNSADGRGGAIYTSADMLITNSVFGANSVNRHKNGNSEYSANDIYIDGENTKVTFNATGDTSLINSGIAGNGILEKTGNGVLNLRGNNEDFAGVLKISNGEVLFSQNSANDTYISGTTNILAGAKLTLDNDEADVTADKFSGYGEISQTGSKNLILDGDNSDFHGSANITGGNLIVKDNSFFADDSSTVISNVIEFNTSSGKEIFINNDGDLISGVGSLTKSGAGKLILSGDNSALTGGTYIQAGTLEYDASGNSTDSMVGGDINVNGNTFIVKNTSNSIFDLNNDILGSGTFNVKGNVSISGDNSQYLGTTNILSDSILSFEKTDDNSFVGGLVNVVGNLYYTTDKTNQDVIQNVIGSGYVAKFGSGDLVINDTV